MSAAEAQESPATLIEADVLAEVAAARTQRREEGRDAAYEGSISQRGWIGIHKSRLEDIEDQVAAGDTAATRDALIRSIAVKFAHIEAIDRQLAQS